MAKLTYAAIASLDEVHSFVNDLERPIGTSLYGRRIHETMVCWDSRTLQTASSART